MVGSGPFYSANQFSPNTPVIQAQTTICRGMTRTITIFLAECPGEKRFVAT